MPQSAVSGGTLYSDYIAEQLESQERLKASLEQRGLSVITTSGVLVTLLFGLAALSTKEKQTFILPTTSKILLLIALVCFLVAIGAGLAANAPRQYEGVKVEPLIHAVKERALDTQSVAERNISLTRLKVLRVAKKRNQEKARLVFTAIAAEVGALLTVASAIGVVIWS